MDQWSHAPHLNLRSFNSIPGYRQVVRMAKLAREISDKASLVSSRVLTLGWRQWPHTHPKEQESLTLVDVGQGPSLNSPFLNVAVVGFFCKYEGRVTETIMLFHKFKHRFYLSCYVNGLKWNIEKKNAKCHYQIMWPFNYRIKGNFDINYAKCFKLNHICWEWMNSVGSVGWK